MNQIKTPAVRQGKERETKALYSNNTPESYERQVCQSLNGSLPKLLQDKLFKIIYMGGRTPEDFQEMHRLIDLLETAERRAV